MSDCIIRSRIEPDIKKKAVQLFEHMGLTMSEAIRLFIYQSIAEKKIPFSINIPNAKTLAALEESENLSDLEETSLEQLKKDWENA